MSGFRNLNKPFFRSDYGMVFCLMVLMGYAFFVILPVAPGGGKAIVWREIWGAHLVATGFLLGALSAFLLHLYHSPEKDSAGWPPFRWGGVLAAILAILLLLWPIFGVERSVVSFQPVSSSIQR